MSPSPIAYESDINIISRLKGHIGSGQFGYVHEGVWNGLPVAVKSLKNEATDMDRIKFLQEAAIMGQFKHPNIIELHGLVNEGEDNIVRERKRRNREGERGKEKTGERKKLRKIFQCVIL